MNSIPTNERHDRADAHGARQIYRKIFYPVFIADGRQNPISWGKPCRTAGEALHLLREQLATGTVSMGVVVVFAGGKKEALENYIVPRSARTAIRHYLDILGLLARDTKAEPSGHEASPAPKMTQQRAAITMHKVIGVRVRGWNPPTNGCGRGIWSASLGRGRVRKAKSTVMVRRSVVIRPQIEHDDRSTDSCRWREIMIDEKRGLALPGDPHRVRLRRGRTAPSIPASG
jgi:hypothetical protein